MNTSKLYSLCTCAIMAALMCILGPVSIPIGPVPVSLTMLVIFLALYLLGTKGGTISLLIYLLLGAFGLPVFSGYSGGLAKLAGPTGGYLIGFIFMALIGGVFIEKSKANILISILGLILGTAVAYAFGTVWFVYLTKSDLSYALSVCVWPFVPVDLGKILVATILGRQVRKALVHARLLPEI